MEVPYLDSTAISPILDNSSEVNDYIGLLIDLSTNFLVFTLKSPHCVTTILSLGTVKILLLTEIKVLAA
jgi:hypothetical protein